MKIIICGAGQVGWQIARQLSGENNDVTIIDSKSELVKLASETLNVNGVVGFDIQPKFGAQDEAGKRLSDIVECHVKKYFDGHGGLLPPKGVYQRIIKELETPIIEVSLRACKGNQLKCAELLGINRNTISLSGF